MNLIYNGSCSLLRNHSFSSKKKGKYRENKSSWNWMNYKTLSMSGRSLNERVTVGRRFRDVVSRALNFLFLIFWTQLTINNNRHIFFLVSGEIHVIVGLEIHHSWNYLTSTYKMSSSIPQWSSSTTATKMLCEVSWCLTTHMTGWQDTFWLVDKINLQLVVS